MSADDLLSASRRAGKSSAIGRPRLVLAIAGLTAGGAERVMTELANGWAARGRSVTLVTWSSPDSDHYSLDDRVTRQSLLGATNSRNLLEAIANNLRRCRRLRRILAEHHGCVVVSFGEAMNVLCVLTTLGLDADVIACERNDPRQHRISRLWTMARRLTYPLAALLVVQTDSVRRWARTIVRDDRVVVIPNPARPVDCDAAPAASRERVGRKRVLAAGRLVDQKGFDTLLRAFARFATTAPEWELILLGDGPLRANLEALADQCGIAHRVTFEGVVPDPERHMAASDVFVLSSRYEGFPNVLLEAMACGLPVISTDCPSGPADIIRDGIDGILVPVDDVERMAEAMGDLATDASRRERLGTEARLVRKRFSTDRIMELWDDTVDRAGR